MKLEEIKALRLRLGWTRSDLARRLGCPFNVVESWEEGQSLPSSEHLVNLQHILQISEACAERLARLPEADTVLRDNQLSQVSGREINELLLK